uniref:Uncharacterized protein n=1 Tax=Globisporangium ultimum (strain ATCC 200006 / CBS 805.95 / DAOM BR144) TaxID=431595 RepID=K3X199_GLOUD
MSSYGGYIPPPFPFPEAWPTLFQTQQTTWLTPTLALASSPVFPFDSTFASAREPAHESHVDANHVVHPFVVQEDKYGSSSESGEEPKNSDYSDDGDSSEGEYVYGYVLSDEWRNRFHASVQARQRLQQQQRSQRQREQQQQQKQVGASTTSVKSKAQSSNKGKKRRQDLLSAARSAIATGGRTVGLQRALAAAKQREATQRRPIAPAATAAEKNNAELRQLETQLNLRFDEFCDAFRPVVWPHDAVH